MTMATEPTTTAVAASIHPDTDLGTVRLTVADLDRSRTFYEQAIGLSATEPADGSLAFGVRGERPLIELRGDSSAPALNRARDRPVPPRDPDADPPRPGARAGTARARPDGRWMVPRTISSARRCTCPTRTGTGSRSIATARAISGASRDGQLEMATLPLDINDLLRELQSADGFQPLAPAGTRIGHVHLQVSDVAAAEDFYAGVLGFDVTVRGYPGALFVSAGGYHHHLGLNTWHSAGSSPPPAGAVGLRSYEITLPNAQELGAVLGRVRAAGIPIEDAGSGQTIRDPSGNGILLRSR